MSECLDSRKTRCGNFRKLLQERIEQASPRRQLTAGQAKRLAKLEIIADKLKRGENVQNRQLQRWLLEDEYAELGLAWQEQQELRLEMADKPSDLVKYEKKLTKAIFFYNRAESYGAKGRISTAKKLYNSCDTLCEQAIEILQEILHFDPSLRTWFDRDCDFGPGSELSADISSLPRLVSSRSHEKQRGNSRVVKKLDVKIAVVERAIDGIGRH